MTLSQEEFIRRFSQHILPKRFVRIRHYGILSSYWKRGKLKELQQKLNYTPKQQEQTSNKHKCPKCKKYSLKIVHQFTARGPPVYWLQKINLQKHKNKNIN